MLHSWRADAEVTDQIHLQPAREIDNWQNQAEAELGLGSVALHLNQLDVGERRIRAVLAEAERRLV